jgi:hypothetical protein
VLQFPAETRDSIFSKMCRESLGPCQSTRQGAPWVKRNEQKANKWTPSSAEVDSERNCSSNYRIRLHGSKEKKITFTTFIISSHSHLNLQCGLISSKF